MTACETCGGAVVTADDVIAGRARYDHTQGGHNDRHTLAVEAAERSLLDGGGDR